MRCTEHPGFTLGQTVNACTSSGLFTSDEAMQANLHDLADAFEPHGIRLLAYLPSGAPTMNGVACEKLQWEWGFQYPWPGGFGGQTFE